MPGVWLRGIGLGQTVMGKKTWRNSKRVNRNKMAVQRKKGWMLIGGSCQRTMQTRSVLDMFSFVLFFNVYRNSGLFDFRF